MDGLWVNLASQNKVKHAMFKQTVRRTCNLQTRNTAQQNEEKLLLAMNNKNTT